MIRPSIASRLRVAQRNKQLVRAVSPATWAERITDRVDDALMRSWAASVILWDLDFGVPDRIDCSALERIAEDYPTGNMLSESALVPVLDAIGYPNAAVRADRTTYMENFSARCMAKVRRRRRRGEGYRFVEGRKDGGRL